MTLTPWKKISEDTLARGWNREFREAEFATIGDKTARYFYLSAPDAVIIIGIRANGTIAMLRQWRPLLEKPMLEFPAGGCESGDPLANAQREFREEVQCDAAQWEWIGRHEACPGVTTVAADVYLAWELSDAVSAHDEHEEFSYVDLTPAEIDAAIARHEITGAMIIAAWHQARPRVLALIDQLRAQR